MLRELKLQFCIVKTIVVYLSIKNVLQEVSKAVGLLETIMKV